MSIASCLFTQLAELEQRSEKLWPKVWPGNMGFKPRFS